MEWTNEIAQHRVSHIGDHTGLVNHRAGSGPRFGARPSTRNGRGGLLACVAEMKGSSNACLPGLCSWPRRSTRCIPTWERVMSHEGSKMSGSRDEGAHRGGRRREEAE
jgi:hypothetical protein